MIQPPLLVDLIRGQAFQTESESKEQKSPSEISPEARTADGMQKSSDAGLMQADVPQRQAIEAISTSNNTNDATDKQLNQLQEMKRIAINSADVNNPESIQQADTAEAQSPAGAKELNSDISLEASPLDKLDSDNASSVEFSIATSSIELPDSLSAASQIGSLSITSPEDVAVSVNVIDGAIQELNNQSNASKGTQAIEIENLMNKASKASISSPDDATNLASSVSQKISSDASSAMQSQANITPQQTMALLK